MKMRSGGTHSKAIVKDDGSIIGFALELSNGRWAPFDQTSNKRLVDISISFGNPKDVLNFFKAAVAGAGGFNG